MRDDNEDVVRRSHEWQPVFSDRIAICNAALNMVAIFQDRFPKPESSTLGTDYELSRIETEAYEAALGLLTREFRAGRDEPSMEIVTQEISVPPGMGLRVVVDEGQGKQNEAGDEVTGQNGQANQEGPGGGGQAGAGATGSGEGA